MGIIYMIVFVGKNNIKSILRGKRHGSNTVPVNDITPEELYDLTSNESSLSTKSRPNIMMDAPLNPHFVEIQYHNDYRDTITAFNNIAPSQRQVFNMKNEPALVTTGNPNDQRIRDIVHDFISEVNHNTNTQYYDIRNSSSGWDDLAQDPYMKDSYEKHRESLGLTTGLYARPASKAPIRLIKIDNVDVQETNKETRYIITIILQKQNVDDQLVVQIMVVSDKRSTSRNPSKIQPTKLIIEDIHIDGYFTKKGIQGQFTQDNFYKFDNLHDQELTNPSHVIGELNRRQRVKSQLTQDFINSMGFEDKMQHESLPHDSNYGAYQVTQTIYDDMRPGNITQFA